jgi:hypothetical protein
VESFGEDDMELDAKKVKGTGKLVKVYDKDGHKYGVMEVTIELPLLKMGTPAGAKPLGEGSFMKLDLTADGCIDGSVVSGGMKGKMTGLMKFSEMGIEITAKLNGTMDSKIEPVKK